MNSSHKLNVALLFGGASPEHEISIISSRNVVKAIDLNQFNLHLIGIDKSGKWFAKTIEELETEDIVQVNQYSLMVSPGGGNQSITYNDGRAWQSIDVVFPLIHGSGGEDGSIQGLLKLLHLPYVGCDILSSAVCMDKAVTKEILSFHQIPNTPFKVVHKGLSELPYADAIRDLGEILYIKPVNLGSSVGISKATDEKSYNEALKHAFQYDTKVLIEKGINGREIECAILGNQSNIQASPVGEVITKKDKHSFYTYEAKYIDDQGSYLEIPAKISDVVQEKIRNIAIDTYTVLGCSGLARVDVFVEQNGNILVNEVNTIPGFTAISMYPKMWNAGGISYSQLILQLIELAILQFQEQQRLMKVR